jgi:hypothetical protein
MPESAPPLAAVKAGRSSVDTTKALSCGLDFGARAWFFLDHVVDKLAERFGQLGAFAVKGGGRISIWFCSVSRISVPGMGRRPVAQNQSVRPSE